LALSPVGVTNFSKILKQYTNFSKDSVKMQKLKIILRFAWKTSRQADNIFFSTSH
jgi:hypothetical protein